MVIDKGSEQGESPKREYRKPRIEEYGSVVDLTRTAAGTIDDGGGFAQRSGAAG